MERAAVSRCCSSVLLQQSISTPSPSIPAASLCIALIRLLWSDTSPMATACEKRRAASAEYRHASDRFDPRRGCMSENAFESDSSEPTMGFIRDRVRSDWARFALAHVLPPSVPVPHFDGLRLIRWTRLEFALCVPSSPVIARHRPSSRAR